MGEKEITLKYMYEFMQKQFTEVNGTLKGIRDDLGTVKEQVTKLEGKVKTLEEDKELMQRDLDELRDEVSYVKSGLNDREQYSRSWSLRISGLQVPREETERLGRDRGVMKYVYDRLLKPILSAAKAKGDIETVPGAYHLLLENGHHVFTRQGRQGGVRGGEGVATAEGDGRAHQIPQIIVRFCSRHMRNVVLRNKKASTPAPSTSEVAQGVKRYGIFEDLTGINHRLLKEALGHDKVLKAWTMDGRLRFVTKADQENVRSLGRARSIQDYFSSENNKNK